MENNEESMAAVSSEQSETQDQISQEAPEVLSDAEQPVEEAQTEAPAEAAAPDAGKPEEFEAAAAEAEADVVEADAEPIVTEEVAESAAIEEVAEPTVTEAEEEPTAVEAAAESDVSAAGTPEEPAAPATTEPQEQPDAPAPEAAAPASEAPEAAAAPKRKIKPWMWAIIAAVVVIGVGIGAFTSYQTKTYDEALEAFEAGNYEQAIEGFDKLGNYKDAQSLSEKASLWIAAQKAEGLANNSHDADSWRAAVEAYKALGDEAAKDKIAWCEENVDYWTAMDLLDKTPTDRDAVTEALSLLKKCDDISYAPPHVKYCENVLKYYEADDLYAQGHYYDAYKKYGQVSGDAAEALGDVTAKQDACVQATPGNGVVWRNEGYPSDACQLTIVNSGNPNAYYKLYIGGDLVITAFVAADDRATFMLPAGVYSMNKAYGEKWFGLEDMFGDDGSYYKCNFAGSETFELQANNGYEISTAGEGTGIGSKSARREAI